MYRALLEGLVYAKRHGKERIEKKTGIPIDEIHICGGGSKSELVMQIAADIFNLKTIRPEISETSGLGAAMLAAVGTGAHSGLKEAVKAMSRDGKVFYPRGENAGIYNRLYKEVYLRQYKKLKPLYKTIRTITGYPE
jgi:sugar (pentulose or hexulose) kinase